jgi:plasmid replication initiation protein
MTSMEQKLFLILLSTIKKEDTETKTTMFRVRDIADIMKVTPEALYKDLPKICKSIMSKIVEVKNPNGDWEMFNIITYAKYKARQGVISLELNKQAEPYLIQLKDFFTSFRLENALTLDSKYAIRIYQLTKSNLYRGNYVIELEDFKKKLKLTQKSYKQFSNINLKVISPSVTEINNKTDINISVDTIKQGKKVVALKFDIKADKTNKQKVIVTTSKKQTKSNISNGFNNFEPREMYSNEDQMKLLEHKLLGWDKDN